MVCAAPHLIFIFVYASFFANTIDRKIYVKYHVLTFRTAF